MSCRYNDRYTGFYAVISSLEWAYRPTSRVGSIYRYSGTKNNAYFDREYSSQGFPLDIHGFKVHAQLRCLEILLRICQLINKRKPSSNPRANAGTNHCSLVRWMYTPQQIIKTMQSVRCSSIVYVKNYTSKKLTNFFQVQKSFLLNSLQGVSPWQLSVSRNYWNNINGTKKTIKYQLVLWILVL